MQYRSQRAEHALGTSRGNLVPSSNSKPRPRIANKVAVWERVERLKMAELQAVIPAQEQIIRRNRPGTKAEDMYNWPDQDVDEMDTVLAGKDHTY